MESADPLANLKSIAATIDKEIEAIRKKEAHTTDPVKKEKLNSKLISKEEVLRSLTNTAKTCTLIEKEKELLNKSIDAETTMRTQVSFSSISAKHSHSALLSSSISSLKSAKSDLSVLSSRSGKVDSDAKKIAIFQAEQKVKLDTNIRNLEKDLSALEKSFTSDMKRAKEDLASLTSEDHEKLKSKAAKRTDLIRDIASLKDTKDKLESQVDTAILNSQKYYLDLHSKEAQDAAIRRINEEDKKSKMVDLCFLIDGTGSMYTWIDLTRKKVKEIVDSVKCTYKDSKFRIAVVIYRDFDQGSNSFQVQQFTDNSAEIEKFLGTVEARGGADGAEDINGGFQKLLNGLEWLNTTKVLIHFADAPCHGPRFNNGSDDHPNPSTDIPWDKVFREVKSLGIDYYFMKINDSTNKMIEAFSVIWNICGRYFRSDNKKLEFTVSSITENGMDFVAKIKKSILDSIQRSMSAFKSSATPKVASSLYKPKPDSIVEEEEEDEKKIIAPQWHKAESKWTELEGKLLQVTQPPIAKILKSGLKVLEGKCKIFIDKDYFSKGTFNFAYPAKLSKTGHKLVAKRPGTEEVTNENLLKLDLKKNGIASSLARDFNDRLKDLKVFQWARIFFINTFLFECSQGLYLLEGFIEGEFKKYTNNLDEIDKTKEIRHFTAFAHFSYEMSKGEYLVTDFQGVNSFLLTDPAIHSRSKEFLESGDFGYEGFIRFFSSHKCNDLCKALKLKQPDLKLINREKWMERSFNHDHDYPKKKCWARFCNKELGKKENKFCAYCQERVSKSATVDCSACSKSFTYKPDYYFLLGLYEPKKCDSCRKDRRKKGGLDDLFVTDHEGDDI